MLVSIVLGIACSYNSSLVQGLATYSPQNHWIWFKEPGGFSDIPVTGDFAPACIVRSCNCAVAGGKEKLQQGKAAVSAAESEYWPVSDVSLVSPACRFEKLVTTSLVY